MMRERPILFSAPMVKAILDGRKTQTRRIVKLPDGPWEFGRIQGGYSDCQIRAVFYYDGDEPAGFRSPYGAVGDRLWVRESVRRAPLPNILTGEPTNARCIQYVADGDFARDPYGFDYAWRWKRASLPSIHLPRDCSRITLAVESVRVERLHDISEEDARAEGMNRTDGQWIDEDGSTRSDHITAFRRLWHEINGGESWDANPWVWVIGFKHA